MPGPGPRPARAAALVAPVLAGVTNARSESLDRIPKLEARHAYGFRLATARIVIRPNHIPD